MSLILIPSVSLFFSWSSQRKRRRKCHVCRSIGRYSPTYEAKIRGQPWRSHQCSGTILKKITRHMLTLQSRYVPSCVSTCDLSKGRQFVSKYFIGFGRSFLFRSPRRFKYQGVSLVLSALLEFVQSAKWILDNGPQLRII